MPAFPAPNDQADAGRGGFAEGHRQAGLGFHLAAPPLSSCGSWRRIYLWRWQGFAGWLRPELDEDRRTSPRQHQSLIFPRIIRQDLWDRGWS
jgi:hypothetical protein